jgi:hypothetical protein
MTYLSSKTAHLTVHQPCHVNDRPGALKAGDDLELCRPDGTVVESTLHALDRPAPFNGKLGLCLHHWLTKTDIPVGTEVWKIGSGSWAVLSQRINRSICKSIFMDIIRQK